MLFYIQKQLHRQLTPTGHSQTQILEVKTITPPIKRIFAGKAGTKNYSSHHISPEKHIKLETRVSRKCK